MLRYHTWSVLSSIMLLLLSLSLSACNLAVPLALSNSPTPTATESTSVATLSTAPNPVSEPPSLALPPVAQAPYSPEHEQKPTSTLSPTPTATPGATRTATHTATPTPSATSSTRPTLTPMSARSRQQMFEKVWQTVDENYVYDDFRGLDWDAIWEEFAPRVEAAETNEEFYALMTEMVNRLQDNHSRFLAPNVAVEERTMSVGNEQHVGIGVITTPASDGAVIRHVFSNSPAAQAGLRPRDRIVAIDGTPIAAGKDITGQEGTRVRLTVMRPDEQVKEVVLTRRHVEGRISPTARRFHDDMGYIAIPTLWINDMSDQVSGALTDLVVEKPLNGLIIDLRGNPGGWRNVLTSVLGHFVQGNVGYFFDRRETTPLLIRDSSGPDLRGMPLVVLIDGNTASYAEVLAAVLQAEADAFVIGVPSAGNTETIYAYELPDGARLWVAQEGFRLRDGTNLEGHGVQPDLLIDIDWTRYSEEKDPHILAALAQLRSQ